MAKANHDPTPNLHDPNAPMVDQAAEMEFEPVYATPADFPPMLHSRKVSLDYAGECFPHLRIALLTLRKSAVDLIARAAKDPDTGVKMMTGLGQVAVELHELADLVQRAESRLMVTLSRVAKAEGQSRVPTPLHPTPTSRTLCTEPSA